MPKYNLNTKLRSKLRHDLPADLRMRDAGEKGRYEKLDKFQRTNFRCVPLYFSEEHLSVNIIKRICHWYALGIPLQDMPKLLGNKRVFPVSLIDIYTVLFVQFKQGAITQREIKANADEFQLEEFGEFVRNWRSGATQSSMIMGTSKKLTCRRLLDAFRRRAREAAIDREYIVQSQELQSKQQQDNSDDTAESKAADHSTSAAMFTATLLTSGDIYVGDRLLTKNSRLRSTVAKRMKAKEIPRPTDAENIDEDNDPDIEINPLLARVEIDSTHPSQSSTPVTAGLIGGLLSPPTPKKLRRVLDTVSDEETPEESYLIDKAILDNPAVLDKCETKDESLGHVLSDKEKDKILADLWD